MFFFIDGVIKWSEWRDHGVPEVAGQAVIDELVETMITEYT